MNVIKGKFIHASERSGTGDNGAWNVLTVVVNNGNQYRNTIPVEFWKPEFTAPANGSDVEIEYEVGGRSYENKDGKTIYVSQLDGKKLVVADAPTASVPEPLDDEDSDLPF